ncbi:MAG: glycine hydroxymethyltransferase, partial [Actinomycetota bacterium]
MAIQDSPTTAPVDTPEADAYRAALEVIGAVEPDVASHIRGELGNQRSQLKLIASENYASPAVLLTMGNWFSDKYAEGVPGHRFYAGCEFVDKVETLAADHAKA